jgi:mono/diheme cytochrome c family protein
MPAWSQSAGGPLTAEQVTVLVDGIQARRWDSKASSVTRAVPPTAPPLLPADGATGDRTRGQQVFAAACATCHGENGQGTKTTGALNNAALLTLMSDTFLRRIIITGRHDLGMPNFADRDGRSPDFTTLTDDDVNDLIALLNHWRVTHAAK